MERLTFTFNSKEMPEYCVYKTIRKPLKPPIKENFVEIPLRNGAIDFNDVNGIYYEDDTIELEICVKGLNYSQTEERLKAVADWLTGKGDLSFSHSERVYANCTVYNGLSYSVEAGGLVGRLRVIFRVPAEELI